MAGEKTFLECIGMLATLYKTVLSDAEEAIYRLAFEEIPDEMLMKATISVIKTRKYPNFPMPGDITEYLKEMVAEKALIGQGRLRESIRKTSIYDSVCFDDPLLHVLIEQRFGDWIKFRSKSNEEIENFLKFEFDKVYSAYAQQKHCSIQTVLLGMHDAQNAGKDGESGPRYLKYVGEKAKALAWVEAYEKKSLENKAQAKIIELGEMKSVKM